MAEEEFEEADIIFQDNFGCSGEDANGSRRLNDFSDYQTSTSNDDCKRKKKSAAIDIPQVDSDNELGYESAPMYDDYDRKMMPPHVILGQRFVKKMAFSICSEDGTNLKGRRLWEIRDSILKLTGFLET